MSIPKPSSCQGCPGEHWPDPYFVPADGSGSNGVLLVFEAAGEHEARIGKPLQGRAGEYFNRMLARGGLNREDFRIHNVLSCRPPANKLRGMPYEFPVINYCASNLDRTISDMQPRAIVAGGDVALNRLLGVRGIEDHRGYVFWSDRYTTWIIPTYHPSHIMRGQTAKEAVFIHDVQRAVEIARDGYTPADHRAYLLDPTPADFDGWVRDYIAWSLNDTHGSNPLSVDIETPTKGEDEDALDTDDPTYTILRIGFAYLPNQAVSIPWAPPYLPAVRRLLSHNSPKLFWNQTYDVPRLVSNGFLVNGTIHDGMIAWHVLNSDVPKGLGYVTTFCCPDFPKWKHRSSESPAYYNAADNDAALRNYLKIEEELKKHDLWRVYERHVLRLDPVLSAMSKVGIPIDIDKRKEFAQELSRLQDEGREKMQDVVPASVKRLQPKGGYVRVPEDTTGLTEVVFDGTLVKRCERCGMMNPPKAHFKIFKKKDNPCGGAEIVERLEGVKRWAKVLPFIPSTKQILSYQEAVKHQQVMTGRGEDRRATTDAKAITALIAKYPDDPLYPLVKQDRILDKLAGTYVGRWDATTGLVRGGMPIGSDGRAHTTFGHLPSTLRLSSWGPNLQNIPRGTDPKLPLQKFVKQMFVAGKGKIFWEVDFSGIEAVLVGWFCGSAAYTRLAKLGVHDFYNAHVLVDTGKLTPADLPSLDWSDGDLKAYFKQLKARFPVERDVAKRVVHLSNYKGTPQKMHQEYPETFPTTKAARKLQDFYYELFPHIPKWHESICVQVDTTHYVRNPFGYVHRFYRVLDWENIGGKWQWSFGDDAKRLIAFLPQSTAAGIIKEALMRLYYDQPLVRNDLRLVVHDSIIGESSKEWLDKVVGIVQDEMKKPVPELPLDPDWNMGTHLTIGVEAKIGTVWGEMK